MLMTEVEGCLLGTHAQVVEIKDGNLSSRVIELSLQMRSRRLQTVETVSLWDLLRNNWTFLDRRSTRPELHSSTSET